MPCAFDPCDRTEYVDGLCRRHHRQAIQGKELTFLPHRAPRNESCTFLDCGRALYARGLCRPHYNRWAAGDDLLPVHEYKASTDAKRREWYANLPEDRKREWSDRSSAQTPYVRTMETRRLMSAVQRAKWATGQVTFVERECVGCKQTYMPNSGRQVWCSDDCQREHRRARYYGISQAQLRAIEAEQNGRCAICKEQKKLQIDHCHSTGVVRGLLCVTCNTGLGKLGDDLATLRRAVAYLERFN